jgi:hypothetical protein
LGLRRGWQIEKANVLILMRSDYQRQHWMRKHHINLLIDVRSCHLNVKFHYVAAFACGSVENANLRRNVRNGYTVQVCLNPVCAGGDFFITGVWRRMLEAA